MTTWPPPAASAPGQKGRGQASAGHRCDGRSWDPPAAAAPSRPPLERLEARDRRDAGEAPDGRRERNGASREEEVEGRRP